MTLSRAALGILALTTLALPAQELRYGAQVHVSMPLGNLKTAVDSQAGLGAGVFLTADLGDGHVLRPRLDFVAFPNATVFSVTNKVNDLSLGVDYLYMLEGKSGFYAMGGLSANRWTVDIGTASSASTKLGITLGAGFAFNEQVSAELRFASSKFGTLSESANTLEIAALYRF